MKSGERLMNRSQGFHTPELNSLVTGSGRDMHAIRREHNGIDNTRMPPQWLTNRHISHRVPDSNSLIIRR